MRLQSAVQELASSLSMSEPSVQQVKQALAQRQRNLVEQDLVDTYQRSDLNHVQQQLTRAIGGIKRIRSKPLPVSSTICIPSLSWVYGYLVFLKLDSVGL